MGTFAQLTLPPISLASNACIITKGSGVPPEDVLASKAGVALTDKTLANNLTTKAA